MKISISQLVTLPMDMEQEIEAFGKAGWKTVEMTFQKCYKYIASHSLAAMKELYDKNGVRAVSAISMSRTEPGIIMTQGEAFDYYFEHQFKRDVNICETMGCEFMLQSDALWRWPYKGWLKNAGYNLNKCAEYAGEHGLKLVIEMQYIKEILDMMEAANHPNLYWCIDYYHYTRFGGTVEAFYTIDFSRLYDVHFCDIPEGYDMFTTQDPDRVLPGEGCLPIYDWTNHLKKSGFKGYLTLELLNEDIWRMKDPVEAARRCYRSVVPYLDL